MDRGRLRRLLCLVALALVVRGALGQALIASAATQRVQERVHEILVSGGKLTPEALLSRDHSAAAVPSTGAQGASAQLQDASKTTIQVAAVEKLAAASNTAAHTDAASTAAVQASQPGTTADNNVETAGKELKLKWALKQSGSVTIQEPDGPYDAQNEAAQVRRKIAGIDMLSQHQLKSQLQHQIQQKVQQQLQQQLVLKEQGRLQDRAITVLAPRTEIDYIEIIPDAEGDESTPEFWQEANSRLVSQIPTLKNLPAKGDADEYSASKEVEWGVDAGGDQEQQHGRQVSNGEERVRRVRVVERKEKLTLIDRRVSSGSDGQEEDEEQQQQQKVQQKQRQKQQQQEEEEEQREQEREPQHQEGSEEGSSKQPENDSAEKEEIINRLNQVDWKSVFEAAQREAEAEERAAEEEKARQKAEAEARRAEQKKRQDEEEKKARAEREEALRRQQRAEDARKAADAKKSEEEQKYAAEEHKYKQQLSEQRPSEYSKVPVSRLIIQEKNRSPLRHFPGGGIYSFTSELTCMSDEEYEQKAAYRSFPMVTSRMRKVTVGLCEWTVAEVSPTPVNKNVFLLGNGWATCTFLKTAEELCMRPLSGGLTLTIQALLYQFAQPKGIKEADTDALVTRSGATKAKPAVSKSDKATTGAAPAVGATVAAESTTVSTAAKAKNSAKSAAKTQSGPYLMEVELQNVFVGLITGAIGPKKAKFKQGAIQFAFGPPPDANEKSYAIETMLPPVHLGGPSLEELQDGQIKLVPGTYQIAFDEE